MKRKILLILFILLFFVGVTGIYGKLNEYKVGEEEYQEFEQYFLTSNVYEENQLKSNETESECLETVPNVNFTELLKINEDIVAWIYIPGTNISYPVVQGEDNSYYVTHTVKKKHNKSGAIFLDSTNENDFSNSNSIIYGHNLQNSKMFSGLRKFLNHTYAKEHSEIILYTPNDEIYYKVFAVFKTNKESEIYKNKEFNKKEDFNAFLTDISTSSLYKVEEIEEIQSILTLSTCTNVDKDERIVVVGYKIEK